MPYLVTLSSRRLVVASSCSGSLSLQQKTRKQTWVRAAADISFHSSSPQTGISTTRDFITILSSDPNDTTMCQHLYPLLPGLIILTSTGGEAAAWARQRRPCRLRAPCIYSVSLRCRRLLQRRSEPNTNMDELDVRSVCWWKRKTSTSTVM